MNISKTTINMAKRLGWELVINEDNEYGDHIWLCELDEEGESADEPDISFFLNADTITFKESLAIEQEIVSEIPATCFSEKQFREVMKFIAANK